MTSTKRFSPSCRFYNQGNCRAGQDCHFAHILPFNKPFTSGSENTKLSIHDLESVQTAIRKSELDQLEKSHSKFIQKKT